jgi:hypothetical protein
MSLFLIKPSFKLTEVKAFATQSAPSHVEFRLVFRGLFFNMDSSKNYAWASILRALIDAVSPSIL